MYFRALSDRKRLAILQYLSLHDRVPVTQLSEEFRLSQPLMSWHLRVLRRAGVVTTMRTGRKVLCSIDRNALQAYARLSEEMFGLGGVDTEKHVATDRTDSNETALTAAQTSK